MIRSLRTPVVTFACSLVVAVFSACGAAPPAEGGLSLLTGQLESMMGPVERETLDLLEDMALVVQSNASRPENAYERIDAFLDVNGARMLELGDAVQQRYRSLDPRTARVYEAQFGAWMEPGWRGWQGAVREVQRTDREWAHRIETLVHEFDRSERARDWRRAQARP
jgi:hypothetical protein